jgi:hypothetical protein
MVYAYEQSMELLAKEHSLGPYEDTSNKRPIDKVDDIVDDIVTRRCHATVSCDGVAKKYQVVYTETDEEGSTICYKMTKLYNTKNESETEFCDWFDTKRKTMILEADSSDDDDDDGHVPNLLSKINRTKIEKYLDKQSENSGKDNIWLSFYKVIEH